MEVDAESGLRAGARLTVNALAVNEPEDIPNNHDDVMQELTRKMYALCFTFSFSFTGKTLKQVENKRRMEYGMVVAREKSVFVGEPDSFLDPGSFLRATAYMLSAHMLSQFHLSVRLSVCLSVCLSHG